MTKRKEEEPQWDEGFMWVVTVQCLQTLKFIEQYTVCFAVKLYINKRLTQNEVPETVKGTSQVAARSSVGLRLPDALFPVGSPTLLYFCCHSNSGVPVYGWALTREETHGTQNMRSRKVSLVWFGAKTLRVFTWSKAK